MKPDRRRKTSAWRNVWPLVAIPIIAGCRPSESRYFQGYIEGEFLYVASPVAGHLDRLVVRRGQETAAGDLLCVLDPEPEKAAVAEAEQRVAAARARLEDAGKGMRPTELEAMQARLSQAKAEAERLARKQRRMEELLETQSVPIETYEDALFQNDAQQAMVMSADAELATARLGAREGQVRAAQAEVDATAAALDQARWRLGQKTITAPQAGLVQDTLYQDGEWIAAGTPIVVLLPPARRIVRFFVPEPVLSTIRVGGTVIVRLDGRPEPFTATISFISAEAAFTQPFIYSRGTREKLVYQVEAAVPSAEAIGLHPGQPVDVSLE